MHGWGVDRIFTGIICRSTCIQWVELTYVEKASQSRGNELHKLSNYAKDMLIEERDGLKD